MGRSGQYPKLTFAERGGISTHTAFMARLFVVGLVETERSSPSLSADLLRRIPAVLMTFATTFVCKLESSSSSPLVKGVSTAEPPLLLERGMEETLAEVEVVVEASKRFIAVFLVFLAMVPAITSRLMLARKETDSGLFSSRPTWRKPSRW
jgi:hypothetical protein